MPDTRCSIEKRWATDRREVRQVLDAIEANKVDAVVALAAAMVGAP